MPLYEYRCQRCRHRFEVLQGVGEGADGLECPSCGERDLARELSTFAARSGRASEAPAVAGCCRGTPT
jgi:putative FmdB family regulatory protein